MSYHWSAYPFASEPKEPWPSSSPSIRPSAHGLEIVRALAWIVAVIVMIVGWPRFFPSALKPELTDEQIQAARAFAQATLHAGTSKGGFYTAADYARDVKRLTAVRDGILQYRVTNGVRESVQVHANHATGVLYSLAMANEQARFATSLEGTVERGEAFSVAQDALIKAVGVARRSDPFRPPFYPEIVTSKQGGSSPVRRFLCLFGLAWCLSLVPAFWGVLGQLRRDGYSLRAEFILRPWRPIGLGVFWWFGLSPEAYEPGDDVVSVRLRRLEKQFRSLHGRDPDAQESAALRGQVTKPIASVEVVFDHVREMPEFAVVPTRRAVFTAWILTCLNAPLQFFTFVTTAVAQTTRTVAAQAVADTTVRKPRGTLWGYFQTTVTEQAIELPVARLKGTLPTPAGTVSAEYRLESGRLKSLSVTRQVTPSIALEAGLITKPLTWDYLPPQSEPLPTDRVISLAPALNDVGVGVNVGVDGTMCQASLTNGVGQAAERDRRLDLNLRLLQRAGPAFGSVSWNRGGNGDDYRSAFAGCENRWFTAELAHARRPDLNRSASRIRAKIPLRLFDLWVQGDRDRTPDQEGNGAAIALERTWPIKSRLNFAAALREGESPMWRLLFQQGVSFISP